MSEAIWSEGSGATFAEDRWLGGRLWGAQRPGVELAMATPGNAATVLLKLPRNLSKALSPAASEQGDRESGR